MVAATLALLALLAFMLAFTFGLAASRFDVRRGLVIDEANAIGTTICMRGCSPTQSVAMEDAARYLKPKMLGRKQ